MQNEEAKKCKDEIDAVLEKYGFQLKIVQDIAIVAKPAAPSVEPAVTSPESTTPDA